jgi:hypothetical protein
MPAWVDAWWIRVTNSWRAFLKSGMGSCQCPSNLAGRMSGTSNGLRKKRAFSGAFCTARSQLTLGARKWLLAFRFPVSAARMGLRKLLFTDFITVRVPDLPGNMAWRYYIRTWKFLRSMGLGLRWPGSSAFLVLLFHGTCSLVVSCGPSSVVPLFGSLGLTGMPFASIMTTGRNMSSKLSSGFILLTMGALLGSGRGECRSFNLRGLWSIFGNLTAFGCAPHYLGLGLILVFNGSLTGPLGVCFTKFFLFLLPRPMVLGFECCLFLKLE